MKSQTRLLGTMRRLLAFIPMMLTIAAHPAGAENWNLDAKLLASDGAPGDWFGYSLSMWGDGALFGACLDDDNGDSAGSAYLFRKVGGAWAGEAKLLAGDGAAGDSFGWSVALWGDKALVGAYQHGIVPWGAGAAYIFRNVGGVWTQEAKLLASDAEEFDRFGYSVALSGDVALVGADNENNQVGAAYVFRNIGATWVQEAKLTPGDGAPMWWFGSSVSVSGDAALIGAYGDWSAGASGSAYVFRKFGGVWVQEEKLLPSDGSYDFGYSVSLAGDTALVGAYRDNDNGYDSGAAYVFRKVGGLWIQEAKLLASDGAAYDGFGAAVSVSNDTVLVGAYRDADNGSNSGSAYIFRKVGGVWTQQAKLLEPNGAANHYFGLCVSLTLDAALVAAPYDDDNGGASGSAYVFSALLPGDIDGDRDVDFVDRELFVGVLLGTDTDPDHIARSDMNTDGHADGQDCQPFAVALIGQ